MEPSRLQNSGQQKASQLRIQWPLKPPINFKISHRPRLAIPNDFSIVVSFHLHHSQVSSLLFHMSQICSKKLLQETGKDRELQNSKNLSLMSERIRQLLLQSISYAKQIPKLFPKIQKSCENSSKNSISSLKSD